MNRRDFLKSLAALPVIGIIPFIPAEPSNRKIKPGEPIGITTSGMVVTYDRNGRYVPYTASTPGSSVTYTANFMTYKDW